MHNGELLHCLEEERELAKQKLQFDAQLAEYENYASLAQLVLGHQINNPLLGLMSDLELEWKQARGDTCLEIEQRIAGTKRISTAVSGLLDYARAGPSRARQGQLVKLVSDPQVRGPPADVSQPCLI